MEIVADRVLFLDRAGAAPLPEEGKEAEKETEKETEKEAELEAEDLPF